jgi:hypothetical protein
MTTDAQDMESLAFDELAAQHPSTLIYNGKKATVIASAIMDRTVMELVGYLPAVSSSIEIKRKDVDRLGLTNDAYVALNGVVLRVLDFHDDPAAISRLLVLHSTNDQDHAGGIAPGDSGIISKTDKGIVPLGIGQFKVPIVFVNIAPASNHVFTVLYVENLVDAPPILDIQITPGQRTANGRNLELNGSPDTGNYVLRWEAVQE